MKRRPRSIPPARERDPRDMNDYREPPTGGGKKPTNYFSLAVLGGVFVLGIVLGSVLNYSVNFSNESITTDLEIAKLAPNPELCAQYGASAIVTETRIFVTLNPRRVFVSQPKNQPGCVLRRTNWNVLKQKDAITTDEVSACRNRMNTFGYTGDIDVKEGTEVDCVYQNDGQSEF